MSEELKPFAEWFDREVETGVRYSDNVTASLGPWSERREKFIRTIMHDAFCAAWNTRTPADARAAFDQAVREAVEAERERLAASLDRRADGYDEAFSMSRPDEHATQTALVQTAKELRRQAAAIRASQETNE